MTQRIRYIENTAIVTKGRQDAFVFLNSNTAIIKKAGTIIDLKATSPHKVKIAVKRTLKGLGFKFKQEKRTR
jgi:predicted metalloprotease